MPDDLATALAALFGSAFLAATLLPGGSEIALAALVSRWPEEATLAIAVGTVGNTLGGLVSYGLGRLLPAPKTDSRAVALVRRYGAPVLLLSWLPVIGDALCVASGWLRQSLLAAALAIAVGKAARYWVVVQTVRALATG